MADHIVSLSNQREDALQKLVNYYNTMNPTTPVDKDGLIRLWVLEPIKEQIRRDRNSNSETLQTAYENATVAVQDQVEALLGINLP